MSRRKRAAIWVMALGIIFGLIIWHVVQWHSMGMYLNMFSWVGTNRAYVTVLYNLGLMVLVGAVLGFLMGKIADLLGDGVKETRHFGGDAKAGKRQ